MYSGSVVPFHGCCALVALVPGVREVFRHGLSERRIGSRDERGGRRAAVEQDAAGKIERRSAVVPRQVWNGQVVLHAGAVGEPLGVAGGHGARVGKVDLLDEGHDLVDEPLDHVQPIHVERGEAVEIDRVGDAADRQVLDVRRLAAEDGDHLVGLALELQRLQVVREGDQVDLGAQVHRRMPPVAVGEQPELPARRHADDLVLGRLQFLLRVARPVGQGLRHRGGLRRIGLGNRQDVHPVERGQVVEVHDVIVQRVMDEDQVADELRVGRNLELQRVFDGADAGHRVNGGADAAESLREEPRLGRIAPDQNPLDAAPHRAARPGIPDAAAVDLHVDAQVTFNPRNGVDAHSWHGRISTSESRDRGDGSSRRGRPTRRPGPAESAVA